jgi:hypothetical protein
MTLFEYAYRIVEAMRIRRERIHKRVEERRRIARVRRLPVPMVPR